MEFRQHRRYNTILTDINLNGVQRIVASTQELGGATLNLGQVLSLMREHQCSTNEITQLTRLSADRNLTVFKVQPSRKYTDSFIERHYGEAIVYGPREVVEAPKPKTPGLIPRTTLTPTYKLAFLIFK